MGSLIVALIIGENLPKIRWILIVMMLGFVAYGLSINFYIKAQKKQSTAMSIVKWRSTGIPTMFKTVAALNEA